jgi:hypothetical protein
VFAAGAGTAIVVGLRRVTVVGLEDPSSPVVRMDLELAPDWSRLAMRSGGRCPRGIEALERFWEALSPFGGGGRDVAAYGDGLLFLNLLGTTTVLDLGREGGPTVVGRILTGMIKDMRYHEPGLRAGPRREAPIPERSRERARSARPSRTGSTATEGARTKAANSPGSGAAAGETRGIQAEPDLRPDVAARLHHARAVPVLGEGKLLAVERPPRGCGSTVPARAGPRGRWSGSRWS